MKIKTSFLFLFVGFGNLAFSQSVEEQMADFHFFREVIYTKEGHLDLNQPQDSVDSAFARLERSLQTEMDIIDQYRLYAKAISSISSGHTQIHPSSTLRSEWEEMKASITVDYFLVGEKLIVNRTLPSDLSSTVTQVIPAGAEILTINNKNVHQMMEEIAPYLSSDEDEIDFKYYQASFLFEFYRHLADPFRSGDSIPIKYVYLKDTLETTLITDSPPMGTIGERMNLLSNKYARFSSDQGRFKILDNEYGYFRFSSFDNCGGRKYDYFLRSSFRELRDRGINKLIVDLRGNTGGQMQYEFMKYIVGGDVYLGRYVVEKPYHKSDKRFFSKATGAFRGHRRLTKLQYREQRKNKFNDGKVVTDDVSPLLEYQGKVVVITDNGTFSAASMLACHLKLLADAKVIGSRPGGTYYTGNAGAVLTILPNSRFEVYVNPNSFYSHIYDKEKSETIKDPDVFIESEITNPKRRDLFFISEAKKNFEKNRDETE